MKCECNLSTIENRVKDWREQLKDCNDKGKKKYLRECLNSEKRWHKYIAKSHKVWCIAGIEFNGIALVELKKLSENL
jgi:hypothetical protein